VQFFRFDKISETQKDTTQLVTLKIWTFYIFW